MVQTVGKRVLALRERLRNLPMRDDTVSFSDFPLYTLGMTFFPGDIGLYDPGRQTISTVVLGSDWGSEHYLNEILESKIHKREPTVAGTDRMLLAAGFILQDCFYANAWPVLRKGNPPEQGHHAMRDDNDVTAAYRDFFLEMLDQLSPRLVVTLGFASAWFLGPIVGATWRAGTAKSAKSVKTPDLDLEPARLDGGTIVVAATHPSHPNNSKHRKFVVDRDETALLVRARRMAGIADAPGWIENPNLNDK